MAAQIKLYDNGMKAMLRTNPRELIDQIGRTVATNTVVDEDDDVEVTTRSYTTDRAAVAVAIEGAAGMAIEAKHSPLMRAAAAAGLQVRRA
ncbi:hypothetical protein GS966_20025 [Rhodococcus hoagii]|nr:hypothetical protein [Prescottella equi]NKS73133.1 hypothetical protein [Prescottella equi]NKZ92215.1 hypothetical protein [Prescottella equi]